jgi:cytochrome d ubiquinol oxidase subunit I
VPPAEVLAVFFGADATFLARIQFAFTVAFHIIFPAFTIGLSSYIATLEGVWFFSGDGRFHRLARYWTKIFAVSFAMGVVSGVPMSYQFGTNWSQFSIATGNVIGPLLGYEVLMAFFLESSFLGVMLFGRNRVPPWLHFFASLMVAFGTLLSAFWILAANSWMQYPAGHEIRDGIAYPVDWIEVIFSPTFPWRFAHMVVSAYLTTAIVVLAVGARYLLAGRFHDEARIMVRMGLGLTLVLAPAQLIIGDLHGLTTAEYQPAKLAAIEAHWDGTKPADLVLFALPNEAKARNDYEIGVPKLGAWVITRDLNGLYKGLNDFAAADRPPVWAPFFAFRLMVAIGLFLIILAVYGGVQWARGRLFESRLFLLPAAYSWPLGFIAVLAGWTVTEVGRQPWLATGIIKTADAASPLAAGTVGATVILFALVYLVVYSAGIYYMNLLIRRGPMPETEAPSGPDGAHVPHRPISAATETGAGPAFADGSH